MKNEKPKIHTADRALLDAAKGRGGDFELKPADLEEIFNSLSERMEDIRARYPDLVKECPYETRLAVTAWVFKAVVEHAKEGGSFRYLIYGRLGFDLDAYVPLYDAGGMIISNEFDLSDGEENART